MLIEAGREKESKVYCVIEILAFRNYLIEIISFSINRIDEVQSFYPYYQSGDNDPN